MSEKFIEQILLIGKKYKTPIMVDPKEMNFLNYKNIKLIKPNLLEAEKILNKKIKLNNPSLEKALKKITKKIKCEFIMLTLGKHGLCIYGNNYFYREKGVRKKITDVTGAGDAVICLASLGFCENLTIDKIAKISNYTGFLSCQNIGTNTIYSDNFTKKLKDVF